MPKLEGIRGSIESVHFVGLGVSGQRTGCSRAHVAVWQFDLIFREGLSNFGTTAFRKARLHAALMGYPLVYLYTEVYVNDTKLYSLTNYHYLHILLHHFVTVRGVTF